MGVYNKIGFLASSEATVIGFAPETYWISTEPKINMETQSVTVLYNKGPEQNKVCLVIYHHNLCVSIYPLWKSQNLENENVMPYFCTCLKSQANAQKTRVLNFC